MEGIEMRSVMSVIIGAALAIFGVLNFTSIVTESFWRRSVGSNVAEAPRFMRRRRIFVHLIVYALIIFGFWAIVHFGPLRPVHEWIR
jgi:hypothetical protein